MPVFKFHILNDTFFELDQEGVELSDAAAIRAYALKIIGQIIQDELGEGRGPIHLAVMVDDEDGVRVANARCTTTLVWSENPFPTGRLPISA